MFIIVGAAIYFVMALRNPQKDVLWFAFTVVTSLGVAMAGRTYGHAAEGYIAATTIMTIAMLVLGIAFDSKLAWFLRQCAACFLVIVAGLIVAWHLQSHGDSWALAALGCTSALALIYSYAARRTGWLYIAGIQVSCLVAIAVLDQYHYGSTGGGILHLQLGMTCFVAGLAITIAKTGYHTKLFASATTNDHFIAFRMGL